jgi:hypothetical protein
MATKQADKATLLRLTLLEAQRAGGRVWTSRYELRRAQLLAALSDDDLREKCLDYHYKFTQGFWSKGVYEMRLGALAGVRGEGLGDFITGFGVEEGDAAGGMGGMGNRRRRGSELSSEMSGDDEWKEEEEGVRRAGGNLRGMMGAKTRAEMEKQRSTTYRFPDSSGQQVTSGKQREVSSLAGKGALAVVNGWRANVAAAN